MYICSSSMLVYISSSCMQKVVRMSKLDVLGPNKAGP